MTPERWQQIQKLLGAAIERPVDERAGYVAEACAGDEDLLHEVESLLDQASHGSGFLSKPGVPTGPSSDTTVAGVTLVGRTISGRYHVKSLLGAGGMGDVYLADDSQLRCAVALKAIRESEPTAEGRARLLREARSAAALRDHASIAAIYDVLDADDDAGTPPLIVMEYVDGQTLSDRMRGNRIPTGDALRYARDIADALAAAHSRGIMHRDLKPANLRVTRDNRIKVLDFGLARRIAITTAAAADTSTMTGDRAFDALMPRIAGTPGYMSPEQLLGRPIGAPSDVFSLGVLLFEMLSGKRPVVGDDFFSAAQALLTRRIPRLADAAPGTSPAVDALVARMLDIDAAKRPTAAAVLIELDAMAPGSQRDRPAIAVPSRRSAVIGALAAIAIVITAGVTWWRSVRSVPPGHPVIAVLPLTNLTGDLAKDYVGIGIAETLTTSLARVSSVSVISRTGLADLPRGPADVRTIARDVGATLLLQGSVQTSGDRFRVNAKLVKPDGSIAWAGEADATAGDLFTLQSRLAESVIAGLSVSVSAQERRTAIAPPTRNLQALEAYWRGLAFLERSDPAGSDLSTIREAAASLERAVALDPQFAAAFGALGETYRREYRGTSDAAWIDRASDAITRGLSIDPDQPDVRLSLGGLYYETGRRPLAIAAYREVLARHPDNDEARRRLGDAYKALGQADNALVEYRAAITLRPGYWKNHQSLGLFYYDRNRLPEAVEAFTRVIEIRPDDANAYLQRGTALQASGQRVRAKADYDRSIALSPNAAVYSNLGSMAFTEARYAEAVEAYRSAIKLRPKRALYHRNLGDAYLKLRRPDEARAEFQIALTLTADALRVNPNDTTTLSQMAIYEAKLGNAAETHRYADNDAVRHSTSPEVLLRRGVALALIGDVTESIAALTDAVAHGYSIEQVKTEDDLAGLRDVPAFRELVSKR